MYNLFNNLGINSYHGKWPLCADDKLVPPIITPRAREDFPQLPKSNADIWKCPKKLKKFKIKNKTVKLLILVIFDQAKTGNWKDLMSNEWKSRNKKTNLLN